MTKIKVVYMGGTEKLLTMTTSNAATLIPNMDEFVSIQGYNGKVYERDFYFSDEEIKVIVFLRKEA